MRNRLQLGLLLGGAMLFAGPVSGQEALHVRIDRLMDAAALTPSAPLCSDAEFLRRTHLDLLGVIPTAAEARAFLGDQTPNKREALVDRLLADPRHPLHLASTFHVMWMERRADKHVPQNEWLKFLVDSFRANKPYDQLVREMLSADSVNPATRPAAKFLLDREADPHLLTRDIGRMFFGVDLQCAQCHDHPLIDDYLQSDYYGLYAFVNRTYLFVNEKEKDKKGFLAEKADGVVEFKSVFTGNSGKTRPRLLGGIELDEPRFHLGDEYAAAPAPNLPATPKFSRRQLLTTALTDGTNPAFRKNIVNRLWARLMGRGLVHPVDLHHSDNPPSNPEVLNLLADEIKALNFQLKPMLRELALTKSYQRAIDVPADVATPANADATLAAWKAEAEKLAAATTAAKDDYTKLLTQLTEANKALTPLEEALSKADAAVVAVKKPYDDANAALNKAQAEHAAKQTAVVAVNEALAKGTEAAKLFPNDAEVASAVGVFQARAQKVTAELEAAAKAVADQTPVVQAALAKLNEAHAAGDAAAAQLAEARKPTDALKLQIIAALNQQRSQNLLAQQLKKRTVLLQMLAAIPSKKTAIASAETAIAAAQAEQAAANQAMETQTAEVAKLTATMAESEKVRAAAQQQMEAAKAVQVAKKSVVETVGEAIGKTEAALAKLPDDADLKVALEKLKGRQEPLTKELAEFDKAVAARQTEEQTAASQLKAAQDAVAAGQTELSNRKQIVAAKAAGVTQAVDTRNASVAALNESLTELTTNWTTDFSLRDLKPLSPEQMGWSTLQAAGLVESHRVAADAEVEKTLAKATADADPAQKANRAAQVEQATYDKLAGNVNVFITFYAAGPGQPQDDFFATPDQALFLANAGNVRGWITPGNPLFNRLNDQADPKLFADELYLSVLTRRPSEPETAAVTNYLAARPNERQAAIQELLWALLASAEFRFQH